MALGFSDVLQEFLEPLAASGFSLCSVNTLTNHTSPPFSCSQVIVPLGKSLF